MTGSRIAGGALLLVALPILGAERQAERAGPYTTWSAYGGTPDQIRYSSLTQINRGNVRQLQVAWTYDSGESGGLQTQPIVADGVLYGYTPSHKTFALRADTGAVLWTFDSGIRGQGANRGVMYWSGGAETRVFAAVDQFLYALDAATGKPIPTFGDNGRIDLRRDLGRDPEQQSVRLTTPGVVYKDLMIVGGRVSEGLPSSPGDIRAYDVRSGALRWSFHTIPHPGEAGHETWSATSWRVNGGANNWPGMALDEAARHRLRADRIGGRGLLRRRSARRQPLRQFAARARCRDRQTPLAFPVRAPRHLGSRSAVAAESRHDSAGWPNDRRGRAVDQARLRVRVRSRHRRAAVSDRGPEVSARATFPAKCTADAQPIPDRRRRPSRGNA